MKQINRTRIFYVSITLLVLHVLGADSAFGQTGAKAPELLGNNSIYQYKTEPIYDPLSKKTFFIWMGKTGDVFGREYNDVTKKWVPALNEEPKKIMEYTRDPADRHNNPAVMIAPNGHILVFQEDHLKGTDGYALMLYTSPTPGSIEGEWSNETLWTEGQPSYPTAVKADNAIYMFMRRKREDIWRVWQFSKSMDNGKTWTEPRTIMDTEDMEDGQAGYQPEGLDEVYSSAKKFYDPVKKRIAMTWNLAGDKEHNLFNKDLYLAYLSTKDDLMYAPTGASLGEFVDYTEMKDPKTKVMVYESEKQPGEKTGPIVDYVHHANYLADGNFLVTYNNMSKLNGKQTIGCARWTGTEWKHTIIEEKPFKEDLSRYGSVQQISGDHLRISIIDEGPDKVRIKETTDGGNTWKSVYEELIDTKGAAINCADFAVPYRPGFPQIMVTTYTKNSKDKHKYDLPGEFPIWGMGDGSNK